MAAYRIEEHPYGFEPQMLCRAPMADQDIWQPLNEKGYWADPDAYSYGKPRWRLIFRERTEAERAIALAMAINGENIQQVSGP